MRDISAIRNQLSGMSIDFRNDFHTLTSSKVELLVDAAKAHGYRKPKNANGSTARYFFAYLNKTRTERIS